MQLTNGETVLMSKYYGQQDLAKNEAFWQDVLTCLGKEETTVAIPLLFNPTAVRRVQEMLDCTPGKCGDCCRYKRISITEIDSQRLADSNACTMEELGKALAADKDGIFLPGEPNGCPFLRDNICSVYQRRPDICWLFPIMGGRPTIINGKPAEQMLVRLKCEPIVRVVRQLITESLAKQDALLLPDLSIVPRTKQEAIV